MTEAEHHLDVDDRTVLARRTVLRGVMVGGAAAAGGALLAACGSDGTPTDAGGQSSTAASTPTPTGDASGGSGGGGGNAEVLVATSDVPDGGGVVLKEAEVVVTQPTTGDYAGFSAICTHAGCVLADVSDGTINCNCHGSQFSIEDGSVVTGPATAPLPTVDVTVDGDSVVRA